MSRSFISVIPFVLFSLCLAGCAASPSDLTKEADQVSVESKEQLLRSTGNRDQLITFYKQQLKTSESTEMRIKLIEAYLESGDIESANFHLGEVESDEKHTAKIVFLRARVAYLSGEYKPAYQYAQTALSLSTSYPEAENLMGLIQAERGELGSAREHFLNARRHYYDDTVIKNNLAVIDLIEEDYQSAVSRLQPLYLKEEADERVVANLVIAYAKLGNYNAVKQMLKKLNYKDEQIQHAFLSLRTMSHVSARGQAELSRPAAIPEEASPGLIQVKVNKGPDYETN